MNAAERDQLQQFLSALRQTRAEPKDPVADALIREAVANQADAPYCLVQRAMGLALSLQAAQARIEQLEAQCAQLQASRPSTPTSSGFWMSGEQAWGRSAQPTAPPSPVAVNSPLGPSLGAPAVAGQPAASAWGKGLMAQAATTAAGVVVGGLLFQGVQSLMGPHGHAPTPASPLSDTTPAPLPGLVSPLASLDPADAGDASWDQGDDWA